MDGLALNKNMPTEHAYEDGEIVPTSEIQHPDKAIDDGLDAELEEIVNRRVDEEVAGAVWRAITAYTLEILHHKNPKVTVTAFAFAAGLYLNEGKSVTELAGELGITKQALDKRITNICKQLGLPPSRGMKSEKARDTYRKIQIQRTQSQPS